MFTSSSHFQFSSIRPPPPEATISATDGQSGVSEQMMANQLQEEKISRGKLGGGKYSEDDAKEVIVEILSVVFYCHLQGVVHRDLMPEVVAKNSTEAMKDSWVSDYADMMSTLQYRKLDFEEFCAAAISVHQLEGMEIWEQHARSVYELFEKDGNRPMKDELASELGLSPSIPVHVVLQDWIRHADNKLSFLGFVRLLHGVSSRSFKKA
ncbi:hypothetical protein RHMOL_Rhmol06G0099600 [Rhododendron molle]|uniref:Uncharacterized protein n=1 Tax=Rhododendron molle TaxID=49168 RepID=A0ACC0NC33_RHOML|nr:hypothetical protein RHMOL_Rhmol06G0099600 [Rhododendron molle]